MIKKRKAATMEAQAHVETKSNGTSNGAIEAGSPLPEAIKIDENGQSIINPKLLRAKKGFNVRKNTDPSNIIDSVKQLGVEHPILIRLNPDEPGTFYIVDGERRYNAAIKAKLDMVPVKYEGEIDDTVALVKSLTANEGQLDLSEEEYADGVQRLNKDSVPEDEIARLMGCNVRKVKEILRALEKGTKAIQQAVKTPKEKGGISARVAARAATLPKEEQEKVVEKLKGKDTREGLKVVQEVEKKIGKKQRGRKPLRFPLVKDLKQRFLALETACRSYLEKDANDTLALAWGMVIGLAKGQFNTNDLIGPKPKQPKAYLQIFPPVKEEPAAPAKKAKGKKGEAKKASAKKAPAVKAAKKSSPKKASAKKGAK